MTKRLILVLGLSLIAAIMVQLYPMAKIMLVEESPEPIVVTDENILSQLKKNVQDKEELNYLVLGDSVARGIGSKGPDQGYGSLVVKSLNKERIPLKLVNKGVTGQTSKKLAESITTPDIREKVKSADLISLTIGGNDLIKVALENQNPVSVLSGFEGIQKGYEQNLTRILHRIRKLNPDAPILMTALYNPISPEEPYYGISHSLLKKWNIQMKQVAHDFPLTHVIDVDQRLRAANGEWLSDQIHPNNKGYRVIAEGILAEIRGNRHTSAKMN
ncbi:GDSL-type esterase/lipase family protein [Paludifilum halophilum]|uniref:SGNH hydrolase-type esterase domain-containing protein n=1 Tax=Paludifilum halophilum TaxID=1642702 RepID=A0A235B5W7_9BACL|nr:GDSL-type esterase/lipase family protein [Paludifilum halophilum]OYD07693.1 hypothetical protein CHM34_09455 [Paludifilum halophilum]